MPILKINRYFFILLLPFIFSLFCCSKKSIGISTLPIVLALSDSAGKYLVWDIASLQKIAPVKFAISGYCGYPRMIQLQNNILVCVYEISGGNINFIRSADLGKTWSDPLIIAHNSSGINKTGPEILELANGSLLVSYNLRPAVYDSSKHYGIATLKSYDGGLSWKDERMVYQASAKADEGCWEPAQILLPSGEIQLFFSNEGVYTNSNEQNISMFRSVDDGLSWTSTPQIISFRAGKRDGMPVPLFLPAQNEIVFSIEDNGTGQFNPSIIRNTLKENWSTFVDALSPNRTAALLKPLATGIYAGAPYLRQLQTGETILSYQSTEAREKQWDLACMNVVIGDKDGKNFTHRSVPFNIPINKMGLWNSLCVLKDNTLLALTSTNAYATDNSVEVWMITGHLVVR